MQAPGSPSVPPQALHASHTTLSSLTTLFARATAGQTSWVLGLGIALVATIIGAGFLIHSVRGARIGPNGEDAFGDITITSCTRDSGNIPRAELFIANPTTLMHSYVVGVEFEDEHGQPIGTADAAVPSLAARTHTVHSAVAASPYVGPIRCEVKIAGRT